MSEQLMKANDIVQNQMYWCIGAGLIPLPLLDVGSVTLLQLDMLRQLCQLYGVSYDQAQGKARIVALAGGMLPRMAASMVKTIPFVGTIVGEITMTALAGASTYAIGQVFIRHFEAGGNMQNINISAFKSVYADLFVQGKELVSQFLKAKKKGDK